MLHKSVAVWSWFWRDEQHAGCRHPIQFASASFRTPRQRCPQGKLRVQLPSKRWTQSLEPHRSRGWPCFRTLRVTTESQNRHRSAFRNSSSSSHVRPRWYGTRRQDAQKVLLHCPQRNRQRSRCARADEESGFPFSSVAMPGVVVSSPGTRSISAPQPAGQRRYGESPSPSKLETPSSTKASYCSAPSRVLTSAGARTNRQSRNGHR
mmetsp:Transcript_59367/g.129035  ORF Transcript_59367/g.129035 Transcript_59367/m.129035 type:complete len:207 (+) Transcript_59367:317-937(+)